MFALRLLTLLSVAATILIAVESLEQSLDTRDFDLDLSRRPMDYVKAVRRALTTRWHASHNTSEVDLPDRIIGGSDAFPGAAPFQAQLFLRVGNGISFTCGGSIISSRTILSAGHCVESADYRIRYGSNSRLSSVYPLAEVERIRRHPNFNLQTITNDIALFILRNPIQPGTNVRANDVVIRPPAAGTDLTLFGFGLQNGADQSSLATNLQTVQLQMATEQECANFIASAGLRKHPGMICAGAPNRGSCNGDSGGPLLVSESGLQTGIVSFGVDGCPPGALDVFTNVAYYLDWIKANMVWGDNDNQGGNNGGNNDGGNNDGGNNGGNNGGNRPPLTCSWVCN